MIWSEKLGKGLKNTSVFLSLLSQSVCQKTWLSTSKNWELKSNIYIQKLRHWSVLVFCGICALECSMCSLGLICCVKDWICRKYPWWPFSMQIRKDFCVQEPRLFKPSAAQRAMSTDA